MNKLKGIVTDEECTRLFELINELLAGDFIFQFQRDKLLWLKNCGRSFTEAEARYISDLHGSIVAWGKGKKGH